MTLFNIYFMAKGKTNYDPDRLVLSKIEILDFCDRVLEKWNKNPSKNVKNIIAMNAVKTSILWTDEESLKAIWTEILNWTYDLLYENAIAQGKEDDVDWSQVMKKLKNKK